MESRPFAGPMTGVQLVDEYFIENRTRLLDLAAFLDRLDRAADPAVDSDFRMRAFREAVRTLSGSDGDRVGRIQMIFSDPRTEPTDGLDQKSACGAYRPEKGEQ